MRRRDTGYTLIELLVALALSAIIAAVVGSLFVGSLSAWRRGRDVREVQIQAVGLVDLMARDVRNSIRAPGVISRPGHSEGDGEPILLLSAKAQSTPGPGQQWILYTFFDAPFQPHRLAGGFGAGRLDTDRATHRRAARRRPW